MPNASGGAGMNQATEAKKVLLINHTTTPVMVTAKRTDSGNIRVDVFTESSPLPIFARAIEIQPEDSDFVFIHTDGRAPETPEQEASHA